MKKLLTGTLITSMLTITTFANASTINDPLTKKDLLFLLSKIEFQTSQFRCFYAENENLYKCTICNWEPVSKGMEAFQIQDTRNRASTILYEAKLHEEVSIDVRVGTVALEEGYVNVKSCK